MFLAIAPASKKYNFGVKGLLTRAWHVTENVFTDLARPSYAGTTKNGNGDGGAETTLVLSGISKFIFLVYLNRASTVKTFVSMQKTHII